MKSIVLAHVLLLSVWWTVAAVPGGVRSMKRQWWDSSSIATTTGCFGPNGGVVIDTTRDVASRYSPQWDIQRKGSHRIHQTTSSNESNHVRLCVHLSDDSQLSEMQHLESQGALKIQSVVKVETSRQLRENSYDWKDFSCYFSVNETFTQMERLSTIYPDFVKVVSIGKSWWKTAGNAGHDIQVMVLTAPFTNATEKVPMMVIGGQHSRELPPPTLILQWAEYMLENYGKDADITWILDRTEIHLIPLANPDGREIVEQHMDWYYRKNARVTACDETKDYGVDLNRNYPMWYKTAGIRSSSDPCTSSYPGSGPLSEPESSAVYGYVHNLFPAHVKRGQNANEAQAYSTVPCQEDSQGILLDIHSSGNMVYFPWGHEDIPSPNHHSLLTMASKLAHEGNYSLWGPGQDDFLYFVNGDATDSSYGIDCVASFGFEIGSTWYAPCEEFESDVVPTMRTNLIYAAKAAREPYRLPLGPDIMNIRLNATSTDVLWINVAVSSRSLIVDHAKFEERKAGHKIESVKLYVDVHPDDTNDPEEALLMAASDGQFDQINESVNITLNTSQWESKSRHILYFQATDQKGISGPVSAVFYDTK